MVRLLLCDDLILNFICIILLADRKGESASHQIHDDDIDMVIYGNHCRSIDTDRYKDLLVCSWNRNIK